MESANKKIHPYLRASTWCHKEQMTSIHIKKITTDDPLYAQELDLRYRILRKPLGYSRADVIFPFENESLHFVALEGNDADDSKVVGCVLFKPDNNMNETRSGRLFQMAVDATVQGKGVGTQLVAFLESALIERGDVDIITLHARSVAIEFYKKNRYEIYGDAFVEVGVSHEHMRKKIA